ncbi:MAG: hypothetical protein FJ044_03505 [Candidatus Cloacimonetes bacterium]|nr:hypothetical protein [Candidatus Cloacimonadota bacterium]
MKEIKKEQSTAVNRSKDIFACYTSVVKYLDEQVRGQRMKFEDAQLEKGQALANMILGLNQYA